MILVGKVLEFFGIGRRLVIYLIRQADNETKGHVFSISIFDFLNRSYKNLNKYVYELVPAITPIWAELMISSKSIELAS